MPMSQQNIQHDTPLGANLLGNGAAFRVWAPRALRVHTVGNFGGQNQWTPNDDNLMIRDNAGYWTGFLSGVKENDQYKFYVVGEGSEGWKRDPYARELTIDPAYPRCNCIVRDPNSYPWHDVGWKPVPFNDLVIYQLHVGTFFGPNRGSRVAKFLDVLDRLDYLVALGVNAVEPLPITEFASPRSLGYDGSDIFSPEMDFQVREDEIDSYLSRVNSLLATRGQQALTREQLVIPINQLKALVDLFHLSGIAVLFDVVYNHAGFQIGGQDESLWFFDRAAGFDPNDSLYFTDRTHTGPVFAIWKQEVRQFLIDNARFFIDEYHIDGFRYDQVSVIVEENSTSGWPFCQSLTGTVRFVDPSVVQVAEYWPVDPYVTRSVFEGGAGFDSNWHDGLRDAIRSVLGQVANGSEAPVNMGKIADTLTSPSFSAGWKTVHYLESHDEVKRDRGPRIAALADGDNARSWYARSRSRVAAGFILTAPAIPMLFMGQEFLEDKQWSDNPEFDRDSLLYWDGLDIGDKTMIDHLRFSQELIALRNRHPALRTSNINVFHVHNNNRVLAFHRWISNIGRDLVVVFTFREQTWYDYRLGLPLGGRWLEVFNSDVYDNWVNPIVAGNGSSVEAEAIGMHGFGFSASLVIPASGFVVLASDAGDNV